MIHRYVLFLGMLAVGLTLWILTGIHFLQAHGSSDGEQQYGNPGLKFSHKFHIVDAGVSECSACHAGARTSKFSSDYLAANHDACATCHEEQVNDATQTQCGYCHTNPSNIQAKPAPKREIIFSHEQHLGMDNVECTTCHAGVERVEQVGAANMPSMSTCSTCHNDRTVSNTCESCHTNFATLVPVDHQRSDFIRNHRDITRLGGLTTDCQTCHMETFCQQCHLEAEVKSYAYGRRRDLMTEPAHKPSPNDSPKQTLLQNVHELNYRFTHGIDAKAKQAECQSCHAVQTFCAECHNAGGNITQLRFKPASHGVPGFTTLGRGSGGGLHAEEARRDMESCLACHDVEGKDPSCMTCHLENGRVR